MNFKNRAVRLAVALSIAGAIATQIPMGSGIALARDGYGGRGNTGGRTAIQVGVAGLVLYGIFATATGGGAAGAAGAAGGGAGIIPPPIADTSKSPIWDVAQNSEDMKQFANAAEKSGIKGDLRKVGQFTAFIPTDAAIAAAGSLPGGFVPTNVSFSAGQTTPANNLTTDQKTALGNYLKGHIVAGRYTIDQLKQTALPTGTDGVKYTTLSGSVITVTFVDNILKVNDSVVEQTDIPTSNGIIHKLSTPLKP